jgi:hypothetical protein
MKQVLFVALSLPLLIFGQEGSYQHKSPAEIQQELDADEALFKQAQEMFNPWYTGPLLAPSASMMPPGYGNLQPYLVFTCQYAAFDKHRKSVTLPNAKYSLNPLIGPLQLGITPSTDISIGFGGIGNWQGSHSGGGYQDTTATLGFLIWTQSLFIPGFKFTIKETFPTGTYQNLNENGLGLSATGGGSWATTFGLATAKLFFWRTQHPFATRLFFSYTVPTPVHVHGVNAYGGGPDTHGTVHPGQTFSSDLGLELSLTQQWVLALDWTYSFTNSTSFNGHAGTTRAGTPASVGGGYSDNMTLAPAVEYNWNSNLGVIAGVQCSVYGRNSGNFAAGYFSVTWTFGPM